MNREPVVITTVIVGIVIAVIEALPEFQVAVTPEQNEAIKTILEAIVAGVGMLFARSQVTPVE